jgi:steroid delta-isomerase-like uncharacterized protein
MATADNNEDNNELNRRWVQAFNDRDWTAEAACRTVDYQAHVSGAPGPLDAAAWVGFLQGFTAAFPDAQIAIEGSISETDRVASRWTITGTHRGEFQGVLATGRQIAMPGVDFSRIVDGKIAEHWAQFDVMAVMQQLGAMPASL